MKNIIILFLAPFICTSVFGQGDFSLYENNGNNLETNFYKKLSANVKNNRGDFTGNPFVEENLQLGTLLLKGRGALSYYMRYNVLEQRIEFSDTNDLESLKMLPKDDTIVIQLGGKTYRYLNVGDLPSGYYEIVQAFDEDRLLLVGHIKNIHRVEQKNSYNSSQSSRIKSSENIYFLNNKNAIEIDNHKKKSVKAFSTSSQPVLKRYIKENQIKFNDDYKGLIAIITKYLAL